MQQPRNKPQASLPARKTNLEANSLSCGKGLQEVTVQHKALVTLFHRWGRPKTDLFTCREALHLSRYYTLDRMDNQVLGQDAFLHRWTKHLLLAFPLPS